MALSDYKITQGEVDANHVKAAPDRLHGTPTQNKDIFDKLVELFVGKYNALIDELGAGSYTATSPISITSGVISHDNSGITQGMYGSDTDQYPTEGGTFTVPYVIVDEKGHMVNAGECDVTLPATYTPDSHTHSTSDITDLPTIPTNTSDLNNDSGFLTSETDPVFTASAAYGIASADITNWNAKTKVQIVRW